MFFLPIYLFIGVTIVTSVVCTNLLIDHAVRISSGLIRCGKVKCYYKLESYVYRSFRNNRLPLKTLTGKPLIFDEGKVPLRGCCILRGRAKVYLRDEELTTLGPGTVIGPLEIIRNKPILYKIVVETGSQIRLINKPELIHTQTQHP